MGLFKRTAHASRPSALVCGHSRVERAVVLPHLSDYAVVAVAYFRPCRTHQTNQIDALFRRTGLQVLSSTGYGKRESVAIDAFLQSGLTVTPRPNSAPRIAHLIATDETPTDVPQMPL
jgi:hypothetical protein